MHMLGCQREEKSWDSEKFIFIFHFTGTVLIIDSKITVNEPELAQQANLHLLSLASYYDGNLKTCMKSTTCISTQHAYFACTMVSCTLLLAFSIAFPDL